MWTCPKCDEQVERNFEACWNCESPRPEGIDLTEKRKAILMKCPLCESKMREGLLRLKTTVRGFLLAGISYKNLYLDDLCVFRNGERRGGYRCDQCGTVIIPAEA